MIIETTVGKYRVQLTYVFADINALRAACPVFLYRKKVYGIGLKRRRIFLMYLMGKIICVFRKMFVWFEKPKNAYLQLYKLLNQSK